MKLDKKLFWIIALAFALRLLVGLGIHFGLPIYGHEDSEDDKAGYVFTDAHRRDDQAWELASSERPILDAFTDKFAYDQYGGLLAFSAFLYRYLSPNTHNPLILIFISALVAALGVPFFWKAVDQVFGEKVAFAAVWIFALYPESILLGSSAMREPYLLTFSAMALYGFVSWISRADIVPEGWRSGLRLRSSQQPLTSPLREEDHQEKKGSRRLHLVQVQVIAWLSLGVGILGMLLVSPAVALVTLIIFAGWMFFTNERRTLSWQSILIFAVVFLAGLFFLSVSLNRSGQFNATSPLHVVNDWLRLTVKWDAYQLERDSGWVQKIFDEGPTWIRLPFVAIYGILQPVLPAAIVVPTIPIWKVIYILRALGWYVLLPALVMSFGAAAGQSQKKKRNIILWLSLLTWIWILLAALRGGGDAWDNPRYRTILFVWQSILAGHAWVSWQEAHNRWLMRVVLCEAAFLLVFTQWYGSRYFYWGGQLPFAAMIALIAGLWGLIIGAGWWQDRKRNKKI